MGSLSILIFVGVCLIGLIGYFAVGKMRENRAIRKGVGKEEKSVRKKEPVDVVPLRKEIQTWAGGKVLRLPVGRVIRDEDGNIIDADNLGK